MRSRPFLLIFSIITGAILSLLVYFTIFVEPSIKLSGIENGKVYAVQPIVKLEESFGITRVTLNGTEITPNYLVEKNGTYLLQGESKLLWKKKTVSYKFEVDDQPPLAPRLKEGVKKVYFKQALFSLDKEERVSYTAQLDGKPVSLDQPIDAPGEHKLTILATKINGLTAAKEVAFSIDNRTFSEGKVRQFLDYYFGQDVDKLNKFTDKVAITLEGEYNQDDVKMVEKAIAEIKTFFPYEMKIVDDLSKHADFERSIKMKFMPTEGFKEYNIYLDNVLGVEMPVRISPVYGKMESLVLIGTDRYITRDYRNGVILHELLHAVGLSNHIPSPESSPLFEYGNTTVTLGEVEKLYGELLYLDELTPNATKNVAMELLSKRIQ
ncbi:hypothetical protein [Bacillus sp. FJAT-29814]|uniref:hypothetical protein n=1 Tax=Bacillus sp. FJAT-29814 TaxID=1729688 RepID=UPI0008325487|nr:hypothetical protein [Bacillus sp. FJAT-29814]